MTHNKKISLVMPCKNEEKALASVLKKCPDFISEIIVVDNLSNDNTVKVAKKFRAKVFIESRQKNGIGYGFALERGIKNASGDIIVCMDGDGSYPIDKIDSAIDFLYTNNLDFVSCNRLPIKFKKKMSLIRITGVKILNTTISILYGYPIKDSLTGMWVFKKETVPFLELSEGGWDLSLEIKINAIKSKSIRFGEFHISYHDRIFDASKQSIFKTGLGHLYYLIKKRFGLFQKSQILDFSLNN